MANYFSPPFVRSFALVSLMLSLPMSGVKLDNARIFYRPRSFCPYRTGNVNVFRRVKMMEQANDIGNFPPFFFVFVSVANRIFVFVI